MAYLILIGVILSHAGVSVTNALYGKKEKNNVFLYTAFSSLISVLFFWIYNGCRFVWDTYTVLIAVIFAVSWIICAISSLLAMRYGSVTLTSMILSFSLMLPTLFGILYWKESVRLPFVIGIVLLCGSLILVNYEKPSEEEKKKIGILWIVCVTLMFFSEGTCSISQTFHQKTGGEAFKAEFMIVALLVVFAVNAVLAVWKLKKNLLSYTKTTSAYGTAHGFANAFVNLGVMLLASGGAINSSVFFPVISTGSLVIVSTVSFLVFKERFRWYQYLGILLGIVSIVFLQI